MGGGGRMRGSRNRRRIRRRRSAGGTAGSHDGGEAALRKITADAAQDALSPNRQRDIFKPQRVEAIVLFL